MASVSKETVVVSSTDADTIPGPVAVCGIKVIAGAGGATFNLKVGGSSGTTLYSCVAGNDASVFENVEFRSSGDLYVDLAAGSGTIYIYRRPC